MQRIFSLFLTATVLVCAWLPLAAQKFQPKNIVFKGVPEYSDAELLAASGLKKGTTLTVEEMKEHFQRLMDTAMFETINYKFDGVDLVYILTPAPLLYPVRLENLPLIPGKDLDQRLHERLPLYRGKVPPEGGMLEGVRGALEQILAAQGVKASVSAMPYSAMGSKEASAMSFAIASPPVKVGSILLDGVSPELESKVSSVVRHESGLPFDTENTQKRLEQAFTLFYTENGYAAVEVNATRGGEPVITPDAIQVPYSVRIQEGRLYRLGTIHLPADGLVTAEEVQKALAPHGDGTASGFALRSAWGLVSARYRSKGYLDCAVTPRPQIDEAAGTVSYTVDIQPGPVYHMALVKFDNVSDEMRKLLMRNWQMFPGDPFDPNYVASFVIGAEKVDPVLERSLRGVKTSYNVLADPQTHEVNVEIKFERRP